ncbi:MAG: YqgE/AlgH family protein [Pacificimonas sp.]|jgi:putative transcriptional regulator|nr:YqgE/AlgH family protein [Pacificimonas sp.]
MSTPPPFLSGQFLLSMPGMGDERFARALIAVCSHDEESALGLIVNHIRGDVTLHGLLEQLEVEVGDLPDGPVFSGGPVEPQRGFVLHSPEYEGQGTLNVAGRWALTATLDILRDIANGKGPEKWLVALGYTGWGEGQLEEELTRHGWLPAQGAEALIWDTPTEDRWRRAYQAEGIDVGLMSPNAGNA